MREYIMSKVGRQLTVAVLLALALACAVYFIMEPALEGAICRYYEVHPEISREHTARALASLRDYVEAGGVAAGDGAALSRWIQEQALTILHVYRQGALLYDSTQSLSAGLHTHAMEHSYAAAQASVYHMDFADGPASVAVTVFPEQAVIQMAGMLLLLACAGLFLAVLLLCIRRKLRYFTRLEHEVLSIAGGALDGPITVRGLDEISRLALCIEEMRRFLVAKLAQEEASKQDGQAWVTSLSHDLRTPLTMLTGYLEILRRKCGDPALSGYAVKACEKAVRLKEMSDMLFACFSPEGMRMEDCGAIPARALWETVREHAALLEEKGHTVDLAPFPPALLTAQPLALKRVMDNVFSNLAKYASPQFPLRVHARTEAGLFRLTLSSRALGAVAAGTGLGLGICANLMRGMGGHIEAGEESGLYVYRLSWTLWSEEEACG